MPPLRLLLWLTIISASTVCAEQILEGYSVVRGKDYAFEIKAPRSWVLDNGAAKDQGINLVFYPTGTNWDNSKAVIYVRVRTNGAALRNISDQVNDTLRNLREAGSPDATVKHVKTLTTQDASKAELYYFTGDKFGNFELTAYIQARGSIHLITLSALASTFGGIGSPICFAALRLMMNSNFVGCSTGRSAGLAPFKILST